MVPMRPPLPPEGEGFTFNPDEMPKIETVPGIPNLEEELDFDDKELPPDKRKGRRQTFRINPPVHINPPIDLI